MIITNELEPLSNDLDFITFQIKNYENAFGRSAFEIGRRIKWVKDHDLAHGQFENWLRSIKVSPGYARKLMTISDRLANRSTSNDLGVEAMYLIATLPPEEQNEPQQLSSGKVKKPADMTVRELREAHRIIKQREQELSDKDTQIADQQAELEDNRKTQLELNNRLAEANKQQPEPKVITKTVTKEVKPDDYDATKAKLAELEKQAAKDKQDIDYYKHELDAAKRIDKRANEYDELQKKELERKERQAEINGYSTSLAISDWIPKLQKLSQDDVDKMGDQAQENLRNRLDLLQQSIDRLTSMLNGRRIIEGDYKQ